MKQPMRWCFFLALWGIAWVVSAGQAQQAVKLQEVFQSGKLFQIYSVTDIKGSLMVKGNKTQTLPITGKSILKYDERYLTLSKDNKKVEKTIRYYRDLNFQRQLGDEKHVATLRPEIRRMVIMRHQNLEIPFSPSGPLTNTEVDTIHSDIFTPALSGLLPTQSVQPKDKWKADSMAVHELTDLGKITRGDLICEFDSILTSGKRRLAKIQFTGEIQGEGEEGPAAHAIKGYYLFDLDANYLAYLNLQGNQVISNKVGEGRFQGSYSLWRTPLATSAELDSNALRGLALDPNEENQLLLFDEIGLRFTYPRRWRVGVNPKQVVLDEPRGNSILITPLETSKVPSGAKFQQETKDWLTKQKAPIYRTDAVKQIKGIGLEYFAFETEQARQRVILEYYMIRQGNGGALLAARLAPNQPQGHQDTDRIARSLQITRR